MVATKRTQVVLRILLLACLILAAYLASTRRGRVPRENEEKMESKSEKVERLLRTVENKKLELGERADAVRELGKLGENGKVVDRLLALLPGEENIVTLHVIDALAQIGDPKALPVLETLGYESGKIHAALEYAIEQCKKSRNE